MDQDKQFKIDASKLEDGSSIIQYEEYREGRDEVFETGTIAFQKIGDDYVPVEYVFHRNSRVWTYKYDNYIPIKDGLFVPSYIEKKINKQRRKQY